MYNVLFDSNIHDLIDMVNKAIKDGWKPQGGIHDNRGAFYQAMYLEVNDYES